MPQLYRVKLSPNHTARKEQVFNGYLAFTNYIQAYNKEVAEQKAKEYGGVIEPIVRPIICHKKHSYEQ